MVQILNKNCQVTTQTSLGLLRVINMMTNINLRIKAGGLLKLIDTKNNNGLTHVVIMGLKEALKIKYLITKSLIMISMSLQTFLHKGILSITQYKFNIQQGNLIGNNNLANKESPLSNNNKESGKVDFHKIK